MGLDADTILIRSLNGNGGPGVSGLDKEALSRNLRAGAAFGCCLGVLCILSAAYARAQGVSPLTSSYITPFPQTDRYQVRIVGDWLGQGLAEGLKEAFKQEEGSLEITDMSRSGFGLVRAEQTDLFGEIDRMIGGAPVHAAIVMLGVNDRASFRVAASRAQPGSAEWKEAYGKEAEKLIKKLRSANIAVYWVGLPAMSNPSFSETVAAMNDAARQAAYVNGAKYIETWSGFTDQMGAYSAYGPDIAGQTKRLRDSDGVGMTAAGNRKLANYVEVVLRRDLAQAKAQRNIPLVGDEEEQARVVPGGSRGIAGKSAVSPEQQAAARPDRANADTAAPSAKTEPVAAASGQEPQRRDLGVFSGSGYQGGETVLSDLGDGLTAIAVISPVGDYSMREIQRQTPLADRTYFKVLSRGDALPTKEGRADDFRWPLEAGAQEQSKSQ
jgi:uncharacterized protein